MQSIFFKTFCLISLLLLASLPTSPHVLADATTETNCNFGMGKGEKSQSCEVPIPSGCSVANFPGYEEPWTNISKGGATECQFDDKHTDWKTKIIGSCTTCRSDNCTARFSVVFNCGVQTYESQKKGR